MKGIDFTALMSGLNYYPLEDETDDEPVPTSIQVPKELHDDLQFIADLWNAFDRVRGKTKGKKWKPASVIRRLLVVGRAGLEKQIGKLPKTAAERKEFLRLANEKLSKLAVLPK